MLSRTLLRAAAPLTIAALLLTGAGCLSKPVNVVPVTLEYWRVDDDATALEATIEAYKKLHSNVDVHVVKMRSEDYERTLLEALAENRGPDIFTIPNTHLVGWRSKIEPLMKETSIPTLEAVDGKVTGVVKKSATLSLLDFQNRYVEGVTRELVGSFVEAEGRPAVSKIMGLPLSADTLGLYYNRELLRRANIEKPPQSWQDMVEQAIKMTVFEEPAAGADPFAPKAIRQAGAPLGLARNVLYNVDILSVLMMQNGARMADDYGSPTFASFTPETQGNTHPPGVDALIFYQSFALPNAQNYSWNASQPSSLDAFVTGKTPFFFGLPRDAAMIRERAPRLDFGVAPVPQIEQGAPANILNYPVEVVSKKTAHPHEAWDFLQFAASAEQVRGFLTATKRPTALRALIAEQLTDADVGPFVGQVLTAKSWYRGMEYAKVQSAFATMIETYPTFDKPEYLPIVARAQGEVSSTVYFNR